jgi:hypothetical protein
MHEVWILESFLLEILLGYIGCRPLRGSQMKEDQKSFHQSLDYRLLVDIALSHPHNIRLHKDHLYCHMFLLGEQYKPLHRILGFYLLL